MNFNKEWRCFHIIECFANCVFVFSSMHYVIWFALTCENHFDNFAMFALLLFDVVFFSCFLGKYILSLLLTISNSKSISLIVTLQKHNILLEQLWWQSQPFTVSFNRVANFRWCHIVLFTWEHEHMYIIWLTYIVCIVVKLYCEFNRCVMLKHYI